MHSWGDESVDWEGISDAAQFLATYMKKWGRMGVRDWKEKWGTVRVYVDMGWYSLLSVTHPGWCHYRPYKQAEELIRKYSFGLVRIDLVWLDIYVFSKIIRPLNRLIAPFHQWIYTRAYGQALKKWPHLRLEILCGADHNELLKKYGVHLVKEGDRSYSIHYDWHKDNYVTPPVEEPWFEKSMEEMWQYLQEQSQATSLILSQDHEGIITLKLKYPGEDVRVTTGYIRPRDALLDAVEKIVEEKGPTHGSTQEV